MRSEPRLRHETHADAIEDVLGDIFGLMQKLQNNRVAGFFGFGLERHKIDFGACSSPI